MVADKGHRKYNHIVWEIILKNEQKVLISPSPRLILWRPRDDYVGALLFDTYPLDSWITFIFGRCHCGWVAATHFKCHDDVIKWKPFPRYWPFVCGIHRSPVNSPYKCQLHGALVISLTCAWTNGWVNNRDASDVRRYSAHYDVDVMVNVYSGSNVFWQCWTIGEIREWRKLA